MTIKIWQQQIEYTSYKIKQYIAYGQDTTKLVENLEYACLKLLEELSE